MTTIPTGTHGILKNENSGVEIPGTIRAHTSTTIDLIIDGAKPSSNSFQTRHGWTFEPDFDPDTAKKGIWLWTSYGLDNDGDLSNFSNLVVHFTRGWFTIGNSSGEKTPLSNDEVIKLFTGQNRPVPLTLKEV